MKRNSWLKTGTLAALSIVTAGAFAQDPADTKDPQGQEETQDEKVVPPKTNEIGFGFSNFRGNPDMSAYGRLTEGLALYYLHLLNPASPTFPYTKLTINGFPKQDSEVQGEIALNRGHTVLRGTRSQYSYFVSDWKPRASSEDNKTRLTLDHSFSPSFGGFVKYEATERDARYSAPRDPDHMKTRSIAGGIGGTLGGGNVGLTVSDRRLSDDTGVRPETLQRQFGATYAKDFGDSLSLDGAASYTRIEQAGLDSSAVRSYALGGALDLGPTTGLQFHLGRQDYDLSTVQNAYVRKRFVTTARLLQRLNGWNLQFGYKHAETERVRADQTFVDVPKTDTYDARLSGRVGKAHVTLRGSWEDLRNPAVVQTNDSRQLQWDDRTMFQAKLDGGGEAFSPYGTYTYKFQKNAARDVEVGWHNMAVGGSYVFSPDLNGYAEFSSDDFRVGGGFETGQALDFYFPNSRTFACGLNWTKDPKLTASASLNFYESGDARGSQLTLSLHRRISDDHDLELVVAPWRHEDLLYDLTGYQTTIVMARYNIRF